ncbi:Transcription factor [Coemansia sp. RSA 552]|nr:Transcription factor [Coemansia sp. RSA 552]
MDDAAAYTKGAGAGAARAKRHKVSRACVYCQRSHMSCDSQRPCKRCIKRSIAHMCHDKDQAPDSSNSTAATGGTTSSGPGSAGAATDSTVLPMLAAGHPAMVPVHGTQGLPLSALSAASPPPPPLPQGPLGAPGEGSHPGKGPLFLFGNDVAGDEFSALSEFLENLQRGLNSGERTDSEVQLSNPPSASPSEPQGGRQRQQQQAVFGASSDGSLQTISQIVAGSSGEDVTQKERFLLTAADPNDGTSEDKLRQIINAKYEAGILKPHDYVKGYSRMQRFMETNISRDSIVRILDVLNTFRPKFRAIAQSLTDIDLLLVEEGFERLLLDYDNVFNSFGVPACLWRRTGEIYKANREFADLVGVPLSFFHEGRVCIYEIMSESSTVNYWIKYGEIAFDALQKAVLTTCVLQTSASVRTLVQNAAGSGLGDSRPMSSSSIALKVNGIADQPAPSLPGRPLRCCFSFTLRRDKYNIPLGIIGNFIPIP